MDNLVDVQTVSREVNSLSKVKYKILVISFKSKKLRTYINLPPIFFFLGGGGGGVEKETGDISA